MWNIDWIKGKVYGWNNLAKAPYFNTSKDKSRQNIELQQLHDRLLLISLVSKSMVDTY